MRNDRKRPPFEVFVHGNEKKSSSARRTQIGSEYHRVFTAVLGLIIRRADADTLETYGMIQLERAVIRRPHLEEDFVDVRVLRFDQQRVQ